MATNSISKHPIRIGRRLWYSNNSLRSLQQYQCVYFSSKRRTRYGSEKSLRKEKKSEEYFRKRQNAEFQKLRDALLEEEAMNLPAAATWKSSSATLHTNLFNHTSVFSSSFTGKKKKDPNSNLNIDFVRMLKNKENNRKRALNLPLFRENSPLYVKFGPTSLGTYKDLSIGEFKGEIHVIHNTDEEAVFQEYLRSQTVFGIDTEAKPDFEVTATLNPVCLIQLATFDKAFLYRIGRGGVIPPILQRILADKHVLKVGHALDDDLRMLKNSNLLQEVNSTADTLPVASKLGCVRPGLQTLCQVFLGHNISKDMQVSNWETEELSQEQLSYAATDAWAPLRIMLEMVNLQESRQFLKLKSYRSESKAVVDESGDEVVKILQNLVLQRIADDKK